jgi:hypothetical protein
MDTSIVHYNDLARLQLRKDLLLEPLLELVHLDTPKDNERIWQITIDCERWQDAPASIST